MKTANGIPVNLNDIPIVPKNVFYATVSALLKADGARCVAYFAAESKNGLTLFCGVANDAAGDVDVARTEIHGDENLESFTPAHNPMHVFEREMHERYGLRFDDNPWLKPLRYSADRFDREQNYDNYPFFSMENEELHEVGVGPIHAGIIEPGHFRFICLGEKVLHLEIVLGYQHRGVERMMSGKPSLKTMLTSEQIAGDSTVAHALAYIGGMEALSDFRADEKLSLERSMALELERTAIHLGDTAALCTDVAYQLGQVACEALRTIVINTLQMWCGNRFAKGLIRPCGTHYGTDRDICKQIRKNMHDVVGRYKLIAGKILSLPSILARFEDIGIVTTEQAKLAGLTGMSARASGLERDLRKTHPFLYFANLNHEIAVEKNGDVLSRLKQRMAEVEQSYMLINKFLNLLEQRQSIVSPVPEYSPVLKPSQICFSMTESRTGEICHTILTDATGNVAFYKIKDPSLHNWFGLALAVRNQDISDFPICNKSFNLSYCGFDL